MARDARPGIARVWFVSTALTVLAALVLQIYAIVTVLDSPLLRTANLFTYFTIQSNVLVGVSSLLVALNPQRASTSFAALWVAALVGISVTAVVFHFALAGLQDLSGAGAVADGMFHAAVPILFVLGWLLFGPRRAITIRSVLLSLLFPLAWLAFTLLRGALTGYYPYPFMNPTELGYLRMAGNLAVIAGLYLALAGAFAAIQAALRRR